MLPRLSGWGFRATADRAQTGGHSGWGARAADKGKESAELHTLEWEVDTARQTRAVGETLETLENKKQSLSLGSKSQPPQPAQRVRWAPGGQLIP